MKPVTELYEAAKAQWLGEDSGERLDKALSEIEKLDPTNDCVLLRLLDLVATLPPERLALVRCAAGLDTADALAVLDALVDAHGRESSPAVARLRDGLMAALSGGGGGAKEEPNHKDEIRALETRLAEVRAKIQCGDRPSSPPVVLLREEDDLRTRLYMLRAAQHTAKPKPTILPAGKPPPFLRVGMVMQYPLGGTISLDGPDQRAGRWWIKNRMGRGSEEVRRLLTLPLAEPFTVEGEE